MAVYFLSAKGIPAIKIGHSRMPQRRLHGCQIWSPVLLNLDAWDEAGDSLTEAELLWRFRADRLHGEWFVATGALQDVIAAVAETGRVPCGWYAPLPHTGVDPVSGFHRAPKPDFYQKKFGLSRKDLGCILGPWAMQNTHLGFPMKYLPILLEHLNAHGHSLTHLDLFPTHSTSAVTP